MASSPNSSNNNFAVLSNSPRNNNSNSNNTSNNNINSHSNSNSNSNSSSIYSYNNSSDFKLVCNYVLLRCKRSAKLCWNCRYFKSNLVYLLYSLLLIYVDRSIVELEDDPADLDNDKGYTLSLLYSALGYIHVINSFMYLWMWAEYRPIFSTFLLPDWLNVFSAMLYFASLFLYPLAYEDSIITTAATLATAGKSAGNPGAGAGGSGGGGGGLDALTMATVAAPAVLNDFYFGVVRHMEFLAALLELVASLGWVLQWYIDYCSDLISNPSACVGRGFTLDDPDCWANMSLIIAATLYFQYNAIVMVSPPAYMTCSLYADGDWWYAVNACVYVLCAMRDNEAFWFMPTQGKLTDVTYLARMHDLMSRERERGESDLNEDLNKLSLTNNVSDMVYQAMAIGSPSSSSSSKERGE